MGSTFNSYTTYKPSSVPWLGDLPKHWEVRRLRAVAEMRVSNVDKHTRDDEIPVRLCNYVDVYKNDHIRQDMDLMRATASLTEVERFRLERDDVLITKDSEAWDDIGVPALVTETADDLISGYHLALLRPSKEILGPFLAWTLQNNSVAYQFHVRANGVTRFGLTHTGIKSVQIPLPPSPEQRAIVRYLDYVDRRIRRYISAKQKLITLLEEEKQAIINQSVTRGLDPNVCLKPSGVEWLGDVPEHWETMRARFLFKEVAIRSTSGRETHLSMSQTLGLVPSHLVEQSLISESYVGGKLCQEGDLVLNRLKAHLGVFALAMQAGVISPDYSVFRKRGSVNMEYYFRVLRLPTLKTELRIRAKGIVEGFWRLYTDDFFNIRLPVPSSEEQRAIVQYVARVTTRVDTAITRARHQIELVEEYRTRLIVDVVTGKLDVREAAAQLPEELDSVASARRGDLGSGDANGRADASHQMIEA